MISDPRYGWCRFKLGTFEGTPSYLTDVPVDLLDAFIDYHVKGCGTAWFDEEGSEFTLVLTPYRLFIIEKKDKPVLHDFSGIRMEDVEKELISDIETNLEEWLDFTGQRYENKYTEGLMNKLEELKAYTERKQTDDNA